MKEQTEYIICAAIWVDNGNKYPHQPINVNDGFVVCGHRHHNCFGTLSLIWNNDVERVAILRNSIQGFVTSHNRFVDRQEAMIIAIEAEQGGNYGKMLIGEELFSEDLY